MTIKNDNMQALFLICMLLMLNLKMALGEDQAEDFFNREFIQGSSWRTIGFEELNDPKNIFFLRIDSHERNTDDDDNRNKRQADDEIITAGTVKINADIEDEFSTQKQELETQDSLQVSTQSAPSTTEIENEEISSKKNFIPINDFLRFRRELIQNGQQEPLNTDGSKSKSQNFEMDHENFDVQTNRGPRGLSTEEWVKFPYQVQRTQKSDESFASPSDFTQPRRVHFITQKQFEVGNPPMSSRQGRVSDQPRDQPKEPRLQENARKDPDLFTPRFRDFEGPSEYPFRFSRGRYYERDLMDRRPDSRSLEFYPRNRDRRIIYYANLPDIPKTSPRFREMGRYRDPFEERYSGSPYRRPFYRDHINEENPMKISADVNVREVKKNPEKRIYSDVKRKYGYDGRPFEGDTPSRH